MTDVILYSSKTCSPCASIKRYLDSKGIDYKVRDIELPTWQAQVQKLTGRLEVPVTVVGETVITGLNYRKLAEVL